VREESHPRVEPTPDLQGDLNTEVAQGLMESVDPQEPTLSQIEFEANVPEIEDCIIVEVPAMRPMRRGKKHGRAVEPRVTRSKKYLGSLEKRVTGKKRSIGARGCNPRSARKHTVKRARK
jgi:hypothetical protein